jgi:hypothetical protein
MTEQARADCQKHCLGRERCFVGWPDGSCGGATQGKRWPVMTERQWLSSADPRAMLKSVLGMVSDRKMRLFAAACWIRVAVTRTSHGDELLAECRLAERIADGEVTEWLDSGTTVLAPSAKDAALAAAEHASFGSYHSVVTPAFMANVLRDIVGNPARPFLRESAFVGGVSQGSEKLWIVWERWLTPDVVALAHAAYDLRNEDGTLESDRLMVLADALEDAGVSGEKVKCPRCGGKNYFAEGDRMSDMFLSPCPTCNRQPHQKGGGLIHTPHPLLTHLRSPGPKYRGMWSLDLLAGKQ